MKKLSLKLEDLQVDSFTTVSTERSRGTVGAHLLTAACFTYGCTNACSTDSYYQPGCNTDTNTTGGESRGQNNCTTLIEE
jgi:hypothetical protein